MSLPLAESRSRLVFIPPSMRLSVFVCASVTASVSMYMCVSSIRRLFAENDRKCKKKLRTMSSSALLQMYLYKCVSSIRRPIAEKINDKKSSMCICMCVLVCAPGCTACCSVRSRPSFPPFLPFWSTPLRFRNHTI